MVDAFKNKSTDEKKQKKKFSMSISEAFAYDYIMLISCS